MKLMLEEVGKKIQIPLSDNFKQGNTIFELAILIRSLAHKSRNNWIFQYRFETDNVKLFLVLIL